MSAAKPFSSYICCGHSRPILMTVCIDCVLRKRRCLRCRCTSYAFVLFFFISLFRRGSASPCYYRVARCNVLYGRTSEIPKYKSSFFSVGHRIYTYRRCCFFLIFLVGSFCSCDRQDVHLCHYGWLFRLADYRVCVPYYSCIANR